jgi:very-short-patch-repair endonuclease
MLDPVLRRLARDQWIRLHGTPRVTVLVGGERGREIWKQWAALAGTDGLLLEGDFDDRIREAVKRAVKAPGQPIAVLATADAASRWRAARGDRDPAGATSLARGSGTLPGRLDRGIDRVAAMVDEGWLAIPEPAAAERGQPLNLDARSVAEATLYEALDAAPVTAGRFRLNESLSVMFGSQAAEVDLLSRTDRIAIEIDGFHHFGDLERYRRDRRKDLLLQTQGLLVVRLLAEDVVRDVQAAVNMVHRALAYRMEERVR